MEDQSVIDIKFKDVLARDLKAVLGKTLDELTKDLIKSSDDALGVSGTLTNLGIIPDKSGRIGGIRFAVDSTRRDDVAKAMRDRLGNLSYMAGVKNIASVLSNTDMEAFSEPFIRLPNNEPAYAKNVLDFIKSAGGEVLWSEQFKDYIALRTRIPHSHIKGSKLSTLQRLNEYQRESFSIINAQMEANRAAEAAEALRKKDTGYISDADLESQEEKRRKLGIITDDSDTIEKQEKSSFFNKSLIYLAGIGETVKRIFGVVSKLYDNALKATYTAQAANVNPDQLRRLEYALQGFGFDRGVAGSALGLISGGLMNPLQLNENLVDTLAPIMGKDTADMVNDMLLGGGDTLSALITIMEAAKRKVAAGGMTGTMDAGKAFSEVYGQLKAAGGSLEQVFQAYMKAANKAGAQGWDTFAFTDFLNLFPAKGTALSADAALQKAFLGARLTSGAENTVYGATYNPAKTYRNFSWSGNPFTNEEDFYAALYRHGFDVGSGADAFSFEPQIRDLIKDKGLSKDMKDELQRILDTFTDMRARKWQTGEPYWSTNEFKLPFDFISNDSFIGPAMERAAQGFSGFLNSGGVNYFDYTTNNTAAPGESQPSMTQMTMNLRVNGKDVGTYPVEIGADNYAISSEISGV